MKHIFKNQETDKCYIKGICGHFCDR